MRQKRVNSMCAQAIQRVTTKGKIVMAWDLGQTHVIFLLASIPSCTWWKPRLLLTLQDVKEAHKLEELRSALVNRQVVRRSISPAGKELVQE